jgi:hypothetical protein
MQLVVFNRHLGGALRFACSAAGTQRVFRNRIEDYLAIHPEDYEAGHIPVFELAASTSWWNKVGRKLSFSGSFNYVRAIPRDERIFGPRLVKSLRPQVGESMLDAFTVPIQHLESRQLEAPLAQQLESLPVELESPSAKSAKRPAARKSKVAPPPVGKTRSASDDLSDEIQF